MQHIQQRHTLERDVLHVIPVDESECSDVFSPLRSTYNTDMFEVLHKRLYARLPVKETHHIPDIGRSFARLLGLICFSWAKKKGKDDNRKGD